MVWSDPIKKYVSRAVEKFCLRSSTTLKAGISTWFCESCFWNFQLEPCANALMLAKQCWKTSMAQSHSSIWLILWGNCKKVWHMCLTIRLITDNRCFQICPVAKFSPQNRNNEYEKEWHWNANDFKEPRLFGLSDTFCRRKHLCLTIYLVSNNEIILDWMQETVFQSQ